jgi:SAM-dependent methyltransferase
MTESKTKATYENPDVVDGYVETHFENPKMLRAVEKFAKTLTGKRVVDVGCGPGHDTWHFAKLGFDATGIDLSNEMIKRAKTLRKVENPPKFIVGDMLELEEAFSENSFDGAWACASLLHIPKSKVQQVLSGLRKIVSDGGKVYIGVKKGEGEKVVAEDKYGVPMERKFTYWQEDELRSILKEAGFKVERVDTGEGGETTWLNFFLENKK